MLLRAYFLLILGLPLSLSAQSVDTVYTTKYLQKSTLFAWTTFGGDALTLGDGEADYQTLEGSLRTTSFGPTVIPRLIISGVHFWGHADFYVSFPLPFRLSSSQA